MAEEANEGVENDSADITPPAKNDEWWKFESKDAVAEWGNKLVEKRLARHNEKVVNPLTQERDTLKAEVERLRPLDEATKTDSQRWEAEKATLNSELETLRSYKSTNERLNLVRDIAAEEGLPAAFVNRVTGDDEDAIREDVKDLLNALSEGGSTGKVTPKQKAPKETEKPEAKKLKTGNGSDDEDESTEDILKQLATMRGNSAFMLRR